MISKAVTAASPGQSSGDKTALGCACACAPYLPHLPSNLHFRRMGFARQAERVPPPGSSASPGPASPNPPSPGCPAPLAEGVRGIKEAAVELPGLVEPSRSSGVNVARMTEDVGTSCPLPEVQKKKKRGEARGRLQTKQPSRQTKNFQERLKPKT